MQTNYKTIPVADMLPIPEEPETYGPRNAEERRILAKLEKAMQSPVISYASTEEFIEFIRARTTKTPTT